MIKSKEICFRCNEPLNLIKDLDEIIFYECTSCQRSYAKQPGKALTDRWLSPISLVLYEIIYNKHSISDETIDLVVSSIKYHHKTSMIQAIIDDIEDEIANPKQKLVDILDLHGTEENTRDYLKRLVKKLKA